MQRSATPDKRIAWPRPVRRLQLALVKWTHAALSSAHYAQLFEWGRAGMDLVYPPQCVGCGSEFEALNAGRAFCASCLSAIEAVSRSYCRRCGISLPSSDAARCRSCAGRRFRFSRVVRLGPYEGDLRNWVLRMKQVADEPLSREIGNLLGEACAAEFGDVRPDWIAPVPMFWRRRMRRQTSSAEIVATAVGKQLGIRVYRRALARTRNTRLQGDLPPSQRRANVRGAFGLRRPGALEDARVLVIDDVLTTGATCGEIAGLLLREGVREISVGVVARAESTFY